MPVIISFNVSLCLLKNCRTKHTKTNQIRSASGHTSCCGTFHGTLCDRDIVCHLCMNCKYRYPSQEQCYTPRISCVYHRVKAPWPCLPFFPGSLRTDIAPYSSEQHSGACAKVPFLAHSRTCSSAALLLFVADLGMLPPHGHLNESSVSYRSRTHLSSLWS